MGQKKRGEKKVDPLSNQVLKENGAAKTTQ